MRTRDDIKQEIEEERDDMERAKTDIDDAKSRISAAEDAISDSENRLAELEDELADLGEDDEPDYGKVPTKADLDAWKEAVSGWSPAQRRKGVTP